MLTYFLHRRRKRAEAVIREAMQGGAEGAEAMERVRRAHRQLALFALLVWGSVYLLATGLLENFAWSTLAGVAIALMPVPPYLWFLVTAVRGVAALDELERRIYLEALSIAFLLTLVLSMTFGLLQEVIPYDAYALGSERLWVTMPLLYLIGVWWAKRRYQ